MKLEQFLFYWFLTFLSMLSFTICFSRFSLGYGFCLLDKARRIIKG